MRGSGIWAVSGMRERSQTPLGPAMNDVSRSNGSTLCFADWPLLAYPIPESTSRSRRSVARPDPPSDVTKATVLIERALAIVSVTWERAAG